MKTEKIEASEIMAFLEKRAKSHCPWCGSESWEYLQDEGDVALDAQLPMKAITDKNGKVQYRPSDTRPNFYIHLRCTNCGCALAFDYFYVIEKIREEKEKA